jgi:alpha-1,2-mannosyltransferase
VTASSRPFPSGVQGAHEWAVRCNRVAVALATAVCAGLILAALSQLVAGAVSPKNTDFISYYSAAVMTLHGHASAVYSFPALAAAERATVYPEHLRYGVLPYMYPPYFLLVLAPLAVLPLELAYAVWAALNVAILGACLWAFDRRLSLNGVGRLLFWLGGISFLPVLVSLMQGQVSVLVLGLLTSAYVAARSGNDRTAGMLLGLALVKPPLVAPLILFFVLRGRWQVAAAAAGTAVTLAAAPAVLIGPGTLPAYLGVLSAASGWHSQFGYGPLLNDSLRGFTSLLLPTRAAAAALVAAVAACLAALWRARHVTFDAGFAAATVAALLIDPHVLIHDLSLLLLPGALALAAAGARVAGTVAVLALAEASVVGGLVLAPVIHIQFAVPGMCMLLGWWLLQNSRTPEEGNSRGC